MNLEEFRAYVEATRNTTRAQAMSALTAKIVTTTEKENSK